MAFVPGSSAGPYRIGEPLGRGGMASVFRAYEPALDRQVALKVLPREFLHDPSFAERFRREAQVVARLEHPNIIPIYAFDIDSSEGIPWMAMRLVAGGALSQLIRRERPSVGRTIEILRGVADALDYAHQKGVVHRDVKPQNVLLDEDGRVYLADFGIAKIVEASGGLTATGVITGTPQYMAPEQAMGLKVTHQVDIYALGIVAYEMLTGRVPFTAATSVAILMKHVQEPLPMPPPGTVPPELLEPVLKCTAKKPEERWPSAGAFVSALESAAGQPTSVRTEVATVVAPPEATRLVDPPAAQAAIAPSARPRGMATGLVLALVASLGAAVLVVVGAGAFWLLRAPTPLRGPEDASNPQPARFGGRSEPVRSEAGRTQSALPAAASRSPEAAPRSPEPASRATETASQAPDAVRARPAVVTERQAPRPNATAEAARPQPPSTRAPEAAAPVAPAADPEVTRLASALGQGDAGGRWRAAQALGAMRGEAGPAVPALVAALDDRSSEVRWRAVEALGLIGPAARAAVDAIARRLADPDPLVRTETAKALGLIGEAAAQAVPQLAACLRNSDVSIRREAARALARIGKASVAAVPDLAAALGDKDKFVRMESARALGRIGRPARDAVPALTKAAGDSEMLVAREAASALQAIGE